MPRKSRAERFLEAVTLLALIVLFAFDFYFWEYVEQAHKRTFNTLGTMHVHNPTSDLFLWGAVAFILYCLTRAWGAMAGTIFQLPEERGVAWRTRLLIARAVTTAVCLGLSIRLVSSYVPDFIDRLPWPL